MRRVVLLPEPEGPSSAKNSPGSISNDHALQRGELAMHLDDILETDLTAAAHRRPPPLTAPTVRPLTICLLRDDAEDDHRKHRQHGDRRELGPQRLLDRDEIEHRDRHRPHRVAAEHDGEQEFVPGIEEHEHDGDGDAAAHLRDDDAPQRPQPAGAVEIGGFLHLEGNVLEIGNQQPDRERQREGQIDQDDALIGIDPADVPQDQEVGDDDADRRQHLRRQHVEAGEFLAAEAQAEPAHRPPAPPSAW